MPSYVDPNTIDNPTFGNVAPVAWGDQVRDDLEYLANTGQRCRVKRSAVQSIPNTTDTVVSWTGTDDYDNDAMHDTAANQSKIVCTEDGKYQLSAFIHWANGTGQRYALLKKNGGVGVLAGSSVDAANFAGLPVMHNVIWEGELVAGDFLEIYVYQNTGGNLDLATTSWAALRWTGVHS